MQKKKLSRFIVVVVIVFILTELILRFVFGFCDAVLMKEDLSCEYIAQPNQDRYRFRNHIRYNEFSMRSDSVREGSYKILGFGDSVINGGSLTDQDSLATTKLGRALSTLFDHDVQVLNISAGSWGPDNCAGYLNKYGDFGAKMILLVVSSHDAYDNMNFEKTVGVNPNFPDKQYALAIGELFGRYILGQKGGSGNSNELGINKQQVNDKFNSGFEKLLNYSKEKNIPFVIYLHPERSELEQKKYNEQGQQIIQFAEKNNVPLINELTAGISATDYRDDVHPNEAGQRKMFGILYSNIKKMSEENKLTLRPAGMSSANGLRDK